MIFLISSILSATYFIVTRYRLFYLLVVIIVEAIVFWNGIIRVYCTSTQLGIKWRLIGIICGWIPLVNLIVLQKIISVTSKETAFESERSIINKIREDNQSCRTKYPLLFVHGVFFRDSKYFNYWGRIPNELRQNGAVLHYGNHQSASSVVDSGQELAERIRQIVISTGCGKVNIIAHSKGGLDCRYAISKLGIEDYVASLTTINTPHYGCLFADYLLSKIPEKSRNFIAWKYNAALKRFGDNSPDFLAAVTDLTASSCKQLNDTVLDIPGVLYQSVGSKLNAAIGGRFPLNFSYPLVKYFDGANDGLVSVNSFGWGEAKVILTTKGRRGISHGDLIDLYRENIEGFDVREFYVSLVNGLKERGL
jgi:triacylglycerol lipase